MTSTDGSHASRRVDEYGECVFRQDVGREHGACRIHVIVVRGDIDAQAIVRDQRMGMSVVRYATDNRDPRRPLRRRRVWRCGGDDATGGDDDGIVGLFPIGANMTYVQYENVQYRRDIACALTICPSVAERTGGRAVVDANGGESTYVTVLTDANVNRATEILRMHGLVIVRG